MRFGALLLEQGRVAEAEKVYRDDLDRHPANPRALHGLAECLAKLGKTQEAARYRGELDRRDRTRRPLRGRC